MNSLVQSPLVRSLNTVPSRMSSFAHGVKDNVPPFSMTRVVVDPPPSNVVQRFDLASFSVPNTTLLTGTTSVRYDIPMYGLLDRAYLLLRVIGQVVSGEHYPINQARYTTATDAFIGGSTSAATRTAYKSRVLEQVARSTSLNFADVIESVELRGNTKPIETLYPGSIASEVQKMPSSIREFYYRSLAGYAAADNATIGKFKTLWDPASGVYTIAHEGAGALAKVAYVDGESKAHLPFVDFLIPLPFSCLKQLKDNYQTRFVEPLHVAVNLKPMPHVHTSVNAIQAGASAGYCMSLVCNFHNFHDVIENSIRDQNYKRGFPASIYGYNFNRSFNPIGQTDSKRTLALTGKELVDECIVMIKRKVPVGAVDAYQAMSYSPPVIASVNAGSNKDQIPVSLSETPVSFHFRLLGSGRELWSGWDFEITGPHAQDFELADGHAYGEDLAQLQYIPSLIAPSQSSQLSYVTQTDANGTALVIGEKLRLGKVLLGFSHAMFPIKFGMQANQNFYTGGLALQTISNPTLEVTAYKNGSPVESGDEFWVKYDVELILRHSQMIRIDSDTGIITTTLTS